MSKNELSVILTVKREKEGQTQLIGVKGTFKFHKHEGNWFVDGRPVLEDPSVQLTLDETAELYALAYDAAADKLDG